MTRLLFYTFLMICSFSATAEIALIETSDEGASDCEASATVRATGTAGPFTILVRPAWGADSLRFEDVSGDITISGLCDKSYQVIIYATAYPQCAKSFSVNLFPTVIAGKAGVAAGETIGNNLKEGELLVQATPNPASEPVTVTVFSRPAEAATGQNLAVTLLTESGLTVERRTISRTGSKTTFPLEAQRFKPGVYLIRVVSDNGKEEGIGKLVII